MSKSKPKPKITDDLVLPPAFEVAVQTKPQTYEEWHASVAPKLLAIGEKIVERLNDNIDRLPPAFLLQYIQQIQTFAGKPAGPSTVHNHQHLHIGRSKEELLAILQRKTTQGGGGRSKVEPKRVEAAPSGT